MEQNLAFVSFLLSANQAEALPDHSTWCALNKNETNGRFCSICKATRPDGPLEPPLAARRGSNELKLANGASESCRCHFWHSCTAVRKPLGFEVQINFWMSFQKLRCVFSVISKGQVQRASGYCASPNLLWIYSVVPLLTLTSEYAVFHRFFPVHCSFVFKCRENF